MPETIPTAVLGAPIPDGEEVKLLIYGSPGIGKTRFIGSMLEDKRTTPGLIIDFEGGTRTIKSKVRLLNIEQLGHPIAGKIDAVRIRTYDDLQRIYDFVLDQKMQKGKKGSYKCMALDTISEINQLALRKAMAADLTLDPNKVPEQRDYLKTNDLMKRLLRALRDVEGLHVVLTAHAQFKAEESASLQKLLPNLIGKTAYEAMAIFEYVGYMRVATGMNPDRSREMIFQPEGRIEAKERSEDNHWIGTLKDPTITMLFDKIGVPNES